VASEQVERFQNLLRLRLSGLVWQRSALIDAREKPQPLPFKSKSQLKFRCSSTIFHPSPGGYQCAVVGPQAAEELFNVRNEFEQKNGRHD
jgi:hypothetical protein